MSDYVVSLLSAFVGTIGFSIFFNIKKERLLYAAVSGTVICGVYLFCVKWLKGDLFLSNLIPSVLATIYAEISARIKKAPSIIFLLPAIIVLIPGGSFYYTMSHLVSGDREQFREVGIQTMQSALGIAVGILLATAFFYQAAHMIQIIRQRKDKQKEKKA